MAQLGSWTYDIGTHRTQWSAETFRIYGVEPGSEPPSCWQLLTRLHSDDRRRVYTLLKRAVEAGEPYDTELRVVTPAGELRWVHARGEPERDLFGRVTLLRGTVLDISARKRQEQQLESERRVLQALAAGAPLESALEQICRLVEEQYPSAVCSVLLLDADGQRLRCGAAPGLPEAFRRAADGNPSRAACGILRYCCLSQPPGDRRRHRDRRAVVGGPRAARSSTGCAPAGRCRFRAPSRRCWAPSPCTSAPRARPLPARSALVARATDIARIAIERSAAERRIQQLAHYDELTGLPNRLLFNQALEDAMRRDHALGAAARPAVRGCGPLQERQRHARPRHGRPPAEGGGGAAAALPARSRRAGALRRRRVRGAAAGAALRGICRRRGGTAARRRSPIRCAWTTRNATSPPASGWPPARRTDATRRPCRSTPTPLCTAPRTQGRNSFCHYSPQGDVHSRERLTLEAHLRRALSRGELDLHYQPKQSVAGGGDHRHGGAAALASRRAGHGRAGPVHLGSRKRPG